MTAVVIYCDASVPHNLDPRPERAVGWGAVIIRGNQRFEVSGAYPCGPGMTSTPAELRAVRLALDHAIANRLARRGDMVFVASDCDGVELYLSGQVRNPKLELAQIADGIRRRAARHDLTLIASHVKGHNGRNGHRDPHAKHNTRADALAKIACGCRRDPAEIARLNGERAARIRAEDRRVGALRDQLNRERRDRLNRARRFAELVAECR